MQIEIWTPRFFKGHRMISTRLNCLTLEGKAYATWRNSPPLMGRSKLIPISDELAETVLGAVRKLCPYNGTEPLYSPWGIGDYFYKDVANGEGGKRVEVCAVCDYFTPYIGVHPERTYLVPEREFAPVSSVSWDPDTRQLTVPSKDETDDVLIIWITNGSAKSTLRSIKKTFPDGEMIATCFEYSVVRVSKQTVES